MNSLDQRMRRAFLLDGSSRPAPTEGDLLGVAARRAAERRRTRRRARGLLVAVCVALVAAGSILGFEVVRAPAAHVVQPAPHKGPLDNDPRAGKGGFTISPTEGLIDGQHVAVIVHGLDAHERLSVLMCAGRPSGFQAGENQCPQNTLVEARTNRAGKARISYSVRRFLRVGWDYRVDCSIYPSGCFIAVADVDNLMRGGTTGNVEPVSFAASPPPAPTSSAPTISVSPASPFVDGQTVAVTGQDFPPNAEVRVAECPVDIDCSELWHLVDSSPTGSFTTDLTIRRAFTFNGNPSPITIDCAQPLTCFIAAETNGPNDVAGAAGIPVSFQAS